MLRRLTDRPFAIHHTGRSFDPEVFDAVLDFGPAVVSCHLAEPAGLIERVHAVGALWMQQVMSVEQARRAIDLGADVIIAQGGEAGGHGGGVATTMLVPQVVDAAGVVPVVVTGGIADGRSLVAALAMGAQGVSMEMLRTPVLEHWAGQGRRAWLLRRLNSARRWSLPSWQDSGQEDVPVAGRPTRRSGDVLPVGEIVRRSLAQAEDALARLQTYRAVRCGLADGSTWQAHVTARETPWNSVRRQRGAADHIRREKERIGDEFRRWNRSDGGAHSPCRWLPPPIRPGRGHRMDRRAEVHREARSARIHTFIEAQPVHELD